MYISDLKAEPNAIGGQIDLSWENPSLEEFPDFAGVKIVRREKRFPKIFLSIGPNGNFIYDGTLVYEGADENFSDIELHGERVYYYTLYTLYTYDNQSGEVRHFANRASCIAVMASSHYGLQDELYKLVPAIYRSYDSGEELKEFLGIFGLQLDLIRSFIAGTRDFFDIDQCHGELLPLLAQWIGWETNFSLDINSQRNQVRQAPELYKTLGTAANLRAFINRLINWNCQIKEFFHNVFLSNNPEQLHIQETTQRNGIWQQSKPITLDAAYEGKMAVVDAGEGKQCLFYHARSNRFLPHTPSKKVEDKDLWHIYCKIHDRGEWLPSQRLTIDGEINKYPAAVQDETGNFWVFWSAYSENQGKSVSQIKLNLLSVGLPARPACLQGTRPGPFQFEHGEKFKIVTDNHVTWVVTFREENFPDIKEVTTADLAAFLNRQLPGIQVTVAENGTVVFTSQTKGKDSWIKIPGSTIAEKLGLDTASPGNGSDAVPARLIGNKKIQSSLKDTRLVLRIHKGSEQVINFDKENSASEVAASINNVIPGIASVDNGKIILTLAAKQGVPFILVNVDKSTAAPVLGFGVPLPSETLPTHNIEPTVFKDKNHNIWLFWCSRRSGRWNICYNRFNAETYQWGASKKLTDGFDSDREPAVLFDSKNGGKIWVFRTRKKTNGHWNIFYSSTTNPDFESHTPSLWEENELPCNSEEDFDRKEPTVVLSDTGNIDLYFSSNPSGSWNIQHKTFDENKGWSEETPVTSGHFTKKAPAILKDETGSIRLLLRSNESITYPSSVYPGTTTIDSRYSGSTTIHVKNREKIGSQRLYEDVLHYVYDTGIEGKSTNNTWYAQDTIGIYLTADTQDQKLITKNRELIEGILNRFLPIHLRAVFIINTVYQEKVYTYDFREDKPQRHIGEMFYDSTIPEVYPGINDNFTDKVPAWIWIHSQDTKDSEKYKNHRTVDFDASTTDTNHRTWHMGIKNKDKDEEK